MAITIEELRPYLHAFDFRGLFVEGLGWDHGPAAPVTVSADGHAYELAAVAEKRGFAVFECAPDVDGGIPPYPVRRRIEAEIAKRVFEHLVVYTDAARTHQVWQWVSRESGRPNACREHRFDAGQTGVALLQRMQPLFVSLDEEPSLDIARVAARVRRAFDVEKVTKRFYDRFRTELTAFGCFIDGIVEQGNRDWYASLMLNRMMFVYFVQKQGFLDNNPDYLRNRLQRVQAQSGGGRFQQFYRIFLLRLFHEGLGQPEAQRAPDLAELLGKVPFLNGGLFDQHELERDNPEIAIPDEAFERVFDFFDSYQWHLDARPGRADNEIDPDVLGYIFEKYVNQKQMGAYYTKEDITGYIARNTVIPFLFDAARRECPVAFGPDGGVWRLLRDDPDRYIYPAVGHGITWNARDAANPQRLHSPSPLTGEGQGEGDGALPLPDEIAAGVDDVSKRGGWNSPAPDDYALPTETWREVVARRQRHAEVRAKLAAGEVTDINECLTLNLDVETFALDVIALCEGSELVRAFWKAVSGVSVLDPTCGSGAFLFAALNVLEPLYTACLEGMRGFLDDLRHARESGSPRRSPNALSDFRDVLDQVGKHPNERYFILKSIVLNNLYGVDIMEEAVEICKLRLFLKLVAQLERYEDIEPLPDIDFNVRAGNTLVGFTSLDAVREAMTAIPGGQRRMLSDEDRETLARIEERAEEAGRAAVQFRWQQTLLGGEVTLEHKAELRGRLQSLDDELDRYLATEYGVDFTEADAYGDWRDSHRPFHWFAEFYGIMSAGGFDVVIGNPPYVQWSKIEDYSVRRYQTSGCPDMYAACVERSMQIARANARYGMILPISFQFSNDFQLARTIMANYGNPIWVSTFSRNPAALFDAGLGVRSSIVLSRISKQTETNIFTTRLNRWVEEFRPLLFQSLEYGALPPVLAKSGWTRIGNSRIGNLFAALAERGNTISGSALTSPRSEIATLRFKTAALYYISAFVDDPPSYDAYGQAIQHTDIGALRFHNSNPQSVVLALTLGKIALIWWATSGDDFHVTSAGLGSTPIGCDSFTDDVLSELSAISHQIQEAMNNNVIYTRYAGKWMGNYDVKCVRHLTDVADRLVLDSLGLGEYWDDLELEYMRFLKMTGERPGTTRSIPEFTR